MEFSDFLQSLGPLEAFSERLDRVTQSWLGLPYLEDPLLGDPLPTVAFETRGFDCVTFPEAVFAAARSLSVPEFVEQLLALRYRGGRRSFWSRHHFPSLDWLPNAVQLGYLKEDLTLALTEALNLPIAENAAWIDRAKWFQETAVGLSFQVDQEQVTSADRQACLSAVPQWSRLKWIALMDLFPQREKNSEFWDQCAAYDQEERRLLQRLKSLPEVSDQENLRREWREKLFYFFDPLVKYFEPIFEKWAMILPRVTFLNWVTPGGRLPSGVELDISHHAFLFRASSGPWVVREASRTFRKVNELPLSHYLLLKWNHPWQKGLNFYGLPSMWGD